MGWGNHIVPINIFVIADKKKYKILDLFLFYFIGW